MLMNHRPLTERLCCAELLILIFFIFLAEPLYSTGRVHEFLFARKKRMAFGADLNTNVCFGGSRFEDITASARYRRLKILWVNVLFHGRI